MVGAAGAGMTAYEMRIAGYTVTAIMLIATSVLATVLLGLRA